MTAQNLIDTPPRLQYISQDIVGIKLEPIVALSSLRQVGVEVLSVLSDTRDSENFFCDRSAEWSITLLEAQLAALKNTPRGHNLFINLPITVLTEPASFQRLIRLPGVPLNIEIVDLASFWRFPSYRSSMSFKICGNFADRDTQSGLMTWMTSQCSRFYPADSR